MGTGEKVVGRAVCYIRVSTEEQMKGGVSLRDQEEKLRLYCELNGLHLVEVIKEEGVSASKALAIRPAGENLIKIVARKEAEHVVALKLDRLFRDAEDALRQTRAWDKAGVALHLVDMGGQTINTGTAMGRFFLNMMAGFAELERNIIAERTAAALSYKKKHREVYSPVPYGFNREGDELKGNVGEQEIIGKIKGWRENGGWKKESYVKIADRLNKENIPAKNGGVWYGSTVYYILKNSLYEGAGVS
jgi:DNA invertase Pin-like site-specific DNA recombinase